MTMLEELARVIAEAMGDNYSDAFKNKERWVAKRGMSGGRFRDINEPFRCDYEEAARAVLESPIITREIDRAKAEGWNAAVEKAVGVAESQTDYTTVTPFVHRDRVIAAIQALKGKHDGA